MKITATRLLFWSQAMAVTPSWILIRPERLKDVALIAHERRHCEQMREQGTVRFWWLYVTDAKFRLRVEVEAYRVQLALHPGGFERMARNLAECYRLDISVERARELLLEPAK